MKFKTVLICETCNGPVAESRACFEMARVSCPKCYAQTFSRIEDASHLTAEARAAALEDAWWFAIK